MSKKLKWEGGDVGLLDFARIVADVTVYNLPQIGYTRNVG
jgi:hypothetical protein